MNLIRIVSRNYLFLLLLCLSSNGLAIADDKQPSILWMAYALSEPAKARLLQAIAKKTSNTPETNVYYGAG
jgi:hypothetical protein